MRDGNQFHPVSFYSSVPVVSLPMRDGNLTQQWEKKERLLVVSLPMRDGNFNWNQFCWA